MAKVLIDIPKENYEGWREHKFLGHCLSITEEAVANGIVLDGLPNGEVHQKVFPSLKSEVGAKKLEVYLYSDAECVDVCDFDWWNRKWGE